LRVERQRQLDDGALLDFLPETRAIRLADWRIAPTPPDLLDRRLEITGPVERRCHGSTLHRAGETAAAGMKPHLAGSPSTII
ncbi:MAG: malate synthase A, partial [Gemmatimonadota bacterium]